MTHEDQKIFDRGKHGFKIRVDPNTDNPYTSYAGTGRAGHIWLAGWRTASEQAGAALAARAAIAATEEPSR